MCSRDSLAPHRNQAACGSRRIRWAMMLLIHRSCLLLVLILVGLCAGSAQGQQFPADELDLAFRGSKTIDLSRCRVPSVVTLREVVKIPAPKEPVLVKSFRRAQLPPVLRPAFSKPEISGVTIAGRYIAIIQTEFSKEYDDVLAHELVHAYITLASPRPLPLWFQEGSAVHFSIDRNWKFYGKPSDKQIGLMVGRKVELPEFYKNKLQNFHFLIEKVGKPRFYEWYKKSVVTGEVNARPLLGLKEVAEPKTVRRSFPVWAVVLAVVVIAGLSLAGYYIMQREQDIW